MCVQSLKILIFAVCNFVLYLLSVNCYITWHQRGIIIHDFSAMYRDCSSPVMIIFDTRSVVLCHMEILYEIHMHLLSFQNLNDSIFKIYATSEILDMILGTYLLLYHAILIRKYFCQIQTKDPPSILYLFFVLLVSITLNACPFNHLVTKIILLHTNIIGIDLSIHKHVHT